jgi:threonine dehydrogenase-like Zn-dependent dehydrogenase
VADRVGETASIPEPSTYLLFGLGAIGLLMVMRRKKAA